MKRFALASILTLCVMGYFNTSSTFAQSANGSYKFTLGDDLTKIFEFDAKGDGRGGASGRMTYTDLTPVSDDESGEEIRPSGKPVEFSMAADFDSLTVTGNRAVMSGAVTGSSHGIYVGRWVQLVVEDNGDNRELPDTLVWKVCRQQPGGWVPSDLEVKDDDGAYRSWWATDLERREDVGIPSRNLIPGLSRSCQVFAISSYDVVNVVQWDGQILVQQ